MCEANPLLKINGLDSAGIEIISPATPNFDSLLMHLLPTRTATVALDLKPLVVIVSNQSTGEIVAYMLVWKVTYRDKRTNTERVHFKYPDAIAGTADSGAVALKGREDLPILSHQQRVVAKGFEVGPSWEEEFYLNQLRSFTKGQKQQFAGAAEIEVNLDAAIFSDGLLVGPNHTYLDKEFMTYFEAKQNLFQQIASDLDSGHDLDEAFAPLKVLAANRIPPGEIGSHSMK